MVKKILERNNNQWNLRPEASTPGPTGPIGPTGSTGPSGTDGSGVGSIGTFSNNMHIGLGSFRDYVNTGIGIPRNSFLTTLVTNNQYTKQIAFDTTTSNDVAGISSGPSVWLPRSQNCDIFRYDLDLTRSHAVSLSKGIISPTPQWSIYHDGYVWCIDTNNLLYRLNTQIQKIDNNPIDNIIILTYPCKTKISIKDSSTIIFGSQSNVDDVFGTVITEINTSTNNVSNFVLDLPSLSSNSAEIISPVVFADDFVWLIIHDIDSNLDYLYKLDNNYDEISRYEITGDDPISEAELVYYVTSNLLFMAGIFNGGSEHTLVHKFDIDGSTLSSFDSTSSELENRSCITSIAVWEIDNTLIIGNLQFEDSDFTGTLVTRWNDLDTTPAIVDSLQFSINLNYAPIFPLIERFLYVDNEIFNQRIFCIDSNNQYIKSFNLESAPSYAITTEYDASYAGEFLWERTPILFFGGVDSNNIIANRTNAPSYIDYAQNGIVNLGSDTTLDSTNGVHNSYSSILGGDQNKISASYCVIDGGIGNSILNTQSWSSIVGGLNNIIQGTTGNTNIILGGTGNIITDSSFCIVGGNACVVPTESHACFVVGFNNSASGLQSSCLGGVNNLVNGDRSSIIGGSNNTITDGYSTIIGGFSNTSDGYCSSILSGNESSTTDNAPNSVAIGSFSKTYLAGQISQGSGNAFGSGVGPTQFGRYLVRNQATNTTPAILVDENDGEFILENEKAYAVRATCIANRNDADGRAMFIHTILVHRQNGSAIIDNDNATLNVANGEAWSIAFSVPPALEADRLRATFTGTSGHVVNVLVTFEWSEVGSEFTGGGG